MVRKEAPLWSDSSVSVDWRDSVRWSARSSACARAGASSAGAGGSARSPTGCRARTRRAGSAGNYTASAGSGIGARSCARSRH